MGTRRTNAGRPVIAIRKKSEVILNTRAVPRNHYSKFTTRKITIRSGEMASIK